MSNLDKWLELAPKPDDLSDGEKWHVFLSYRSVHRRWVLELYDVLRHLGYEVFMDQYALAASSTLVGGLEEGLHKSTAGILVLSKATLNSDWCNKEREAMEGKATRDKSFHYIAITLDDCELPFWVQQRIYVNFSDCKEGPRGSGLLRLLYGISGKALPDGAVKLATQVDEEVRDALDDIESACLSGNAKWLLELAHSDNLAWQTSPLPGSRAADALIKLKKYDEALIVINRLQDHFPKTVRPKQLQGLALARKGDWQSAQDILGKLYAAGERDPETLGIYARTWMDRYEQSKNILHLIRSRNLYAEAFNHSDKDFYTGINAAAKSVLLGELTKAAEYADRVEKIVGTKKVEGDYWKTATVAEVQLIKQNYQQAAELYGEAVSMAPEEIGSHESTWTQAKRLMEKLQPPPAAREFIANVFAHLT